MLVQFEYFNYTFERKGLWPHQVVDNHIFGWLYTVPTENGFVILTKHIWHL